ncbi:transposase [Kitasatospora sp. NPDC092286]|uniref:transposase n=1 Tax=Kitasatospora sp. NPDC092286 TaxID=3364087 RepID=UPI00381E71DF
MDLVDPGREVQTGRPSKYSDEFRRDAVALYRASEGRRTFAAVAKEIGVNHETLRNWVRCRCRAGVGRADAERRGAGRARAASQGRARVAGREGDPAPGRRVFRTGDEVRARRWDFVSAHAAEFGVQRLCEILGVARSGYCAWRAGARARADRAAAEAAPLLVPGGPPGDAGRLRGSEGAGGTAGPRSGGQPQADSPPDA